MAAVQIDVKIQNTVTLGATVLNNNSASYASYAILLDQAIGHQVQSHSLYSRPAYAWSRPQCLLKSADHDLQSV